MSQVLVVGVDIAKKDFAVACGVRDMVMDLGKFANDGEGHAALRVALAEVCAKVGL